MAKPDKRTRERTGSSPSCFLGCFRFSRKKFSEKPIVSPEGGERKRKKKKNRWFSWSRFRLKNGEVNPSPIYETEKTNLNSNAKKESDKSRSVPVISHVTDQRNSRADDKAAKLETEESFPSFPNPRILDDEGSDLRREDAVDYVIDGPDDDCHCARAYNLIRMVIQHSSRGERAYDVFSGLLEDRIICINGPISDNTFHVFFAQLLFSSSPRTLLSVSICTSIRLVAVSPQAAASMISLLLAAGATVHRRSRPNPTIMIHQPSGGYSGQGVRETIVSASVAKGLKTEPSYHMAKRCMASPI
ncbi:PREDICTED: uncharacterized protein LOC104819377 isoform X2 [Tarenaya hassleriana]|uniref:uncharacterized protein LOC104819377 isoform X2 n=1 Tax=Tarenaya hassleriana TaxID=28532 RepID=UPI0008FD62B1|nr:PREDICTED: uncharacterized protein LOC104819377 isoform X2 [Tarenaya hassleriana]